MFDYAMLLRRYRGNYGISQEQLAEQLGVTPATISRIENRKQQPSAPLMRRILASCRRPEVEGVVMQLAAMVRSAETYLILIDERIVIAASLGACGGDCEEQRRVEGVEFRRLFVPTTLALLEQAEAYGGLWGGQIQQIRTAWPYILGGIYRGTLTPLNLDGGRYAIVEARRCDVTSPYAEIVCLPDVHLEPIPLAHLFPSQGYGSRLATLKSLNRPLENLLYDATRGADKFDFQPSKAPLEG